jgi:hypothetical protein
MARREQGEGVIDFLLELQEKKERGDCQLFESLEDGPEGREGGGR